MSVPPEKNLISESPDRVSRATAILKCSPVRIFGNLGHIYLTNVTAPHAMASSNDCMSAIFLAVVQYVWVGNTISLYIEMTSSYV